MWVKRLTKDEKERWMLAPTVKNLETFGNLFFYGGIE